MDLKKFKYISLQDLDSVSLLRRYDSKFTFHSMHLDILLEKLLDKYKILEIEGKRKFSYDNIYYDTKDLLFYNQHHNGTRNRYKVRTRKYLESNQLFFEIKIKNNKNKTIKKRININNENITNNEAVTDLITNTVGHISKDLIPSLYVKFSRMTFIDNDSTERLTIDTNLAVNNTTSSSSQYEKLIICEIKQKKYNPKSSFIKIIRDLKIPEMRFSKYCIGLVNLNDNIKYNRFKEKNIYLNKII
tara:strand:- start:1329 stop:2063 length:735 start_codon:yes stop_codon:yes gene_type:complete